MHRSSSSCRASDEFLVNLLPAAMAMKTSSPVNVLSSDDLPIYNPVSDATKKEIALHQKSIAENAIHLIPFVLFLCALILWVFSRTGDM